MKVLLPIILVAVTVVLVALALFGVGPSHGTVGIASGSALPGFTPKADSPAQALTNFLTDVRRRNWDRAYASLSKKSDIDEPTFIQDWIGSNGSLRSLSSLENVDPRPLHETNDQADE